MKAHTSLRQLANRTQLTVRIGRILYAISPERRGAKGAIRPFEVHTIDARGVRHPVADLSAVLTRGQEFFVRAMASALASGVEVVLEPQEPEAGEDAPAVATRHHRASSDPATCDHPRIYPVFSTDSEVCPDCNAHGAMGSL